MANLMPMKKYEVAVSQSDKKELVEQVINIARQAGEAIMQVYRSDFAHVSKADNSPLTEADLAAHKIIVAGLAAISDLPCLSEESDGEQMSWQRRQSWGDYWLVDPLDGTKEFIARSGEFTVNIALISQGRAIMGVVYCPVTELLYYAEQGLGAFKQDKHMPATSLLVAAPPEGDRPWLLVGSRRHGAKALAQFTQQLSNVELLEKGSSLKLCLVGEGAADLYPRLAPTCEWDTAAAQAIVECAGGQVLGPDLQPLRYGEKEDLLNPNFIVCAKVDQRWRESFVALAGQ